MLFLVTSLLAQLQDWQKEPYVYKDEGSNPGAATFKAFEVIFSNLLSVVFILGGFAAFAMLLVGGFRYLLSGGDPKASAAAKGTITWAIAGLILLIAAWFILRLIQEFTGAPVTIFKIPGGEN